MNTISQQLGQLAQPMSFTVNLTQLSTVASPMDSFDLLPKGGFSDWIPRVRPGVLFTQEEVEFDQSIEKKTQSEEVRAPRDPQEFSGWDPVSGILTGAFLLGTLYRVGKIGVLYRNRKESQILDLQRVGRAFGTTMKKQALLFPLAAINFGLGAHFHHALRYDQSILFLMIAHYLALSFVQSGLEQSERGLAGLEHALDQIKTLRDGPRKRIDYKHAASELASYFVTDKMKSDEDIASYIPEIQVVIQDIRQVVKKDEISSMHKKMIRNVLSDLDALDRWLDFIKPRK